MTNPITPPLELVQQWSDIKPMEDAVVQNWVKIATKAARWGADQELEECCEWLDFYSSATDARDLRLARRPQSLSLKEQALEAQRRMWSGQSNHDDWDLVRRALEQLPD